MQQQQETNIPAEQPQQEWAPEEWEDMSAILQQMYW
jgi:hypothetical protein